MTEMLFGSLEVERLHGEKFISVRAAKDAAMDWILWYNQKRMHSTIGYQSPVESEQAWLQVQLEAARKAGCETMKIAARFPHFHNLGDDGIIPSTPTHTGYAF